MEIFLVTRDDGYFPIIKCFIMEDEAQEFLKEINRFMIRGDKCSLYACIYEIRKYDDFYTIGDKYLIQKHILI